MSDDDNDLGEKLARMEQLFDAAIETKMTENAIDFLAKARLLLRITGYDLGAACEAIHTPPGAEAARREYDALPEAERIELCQEVTDHWSAMTSVAVRRLWHACEVLGFTPDTIDPKHVALVAATYLGTPERGGVDG